MRTARLLRKRNENPLLLKSSRRKQVGAAATRAHVSLKWCTPGLLQRRHRNTASQERVAEAIPSPRPEHLKW